MSTLNRGKSSKRRRFRPPQSANSSGTASEERLLHQVIQNSKLDLSAKGKIDVPWAPTFYPSVEDMEGTPLDYIGEKVTLPLGRLLDITSYRA
jgi:hypothetical protein